MQRATGLGVLLTLPQLAQYLHGVWSSPLRIIIALVMLYYQLSWAALCGASILVLMIPVQKKVVGISARYLKQALKFKDEVCASYSASYTAAPQADHDLCMHCSG